MTFRALASLSALLFLSAAPAMAQDGPPEIDLSTATSILTSSSSGSSSSSPTLLPGCLNPIVGSEIIIDVNPASSGDSTCSKQCKRVVQACEQANSNNGLKCSGISFDS